MSEAQLHHIDATLKQHQRSGGLFPNFSIGAVLLMQFAKQASKYFKHAEIIELHHNRKADAPSGTSLRTAALMHEANPEGFAHTNAVEHETVNGARGAKVAGNIHIHSLRLPGLVAHQEVLLAEPGQLLTLRHDSFNRDCFMAGMVLCCQHITSLPHGLSIGLEHILDLSETTA
jgi:4-hydroxy-tetrahydrodipicolinate reductase